MRKRKLVDEVRGERNVSIRRPCRVLLLDTSSYHYKSRRPGQAVLEQRIKEICQTRVRYSYRRVHVLLCREVWRINHKKTYRVYREMGLQLRNKRPKRRVEAKLRNDRKIATRPNESWAMDFLHDQLATGRKIRVLTRSPFSMRARAKRGAVAFDGEQVHQKRGVLPGRRGARTERLQLLPCRRFRPLFSLGSDKIFPREAWKSVLSPPRSLGPTRVFLDPPGTLVVFGQCSRGLLPERRQLGFRHVTGLR